MYKTPFHIGNLILPHRLIQGPLAGYSAAPMRVLFNEFMAPAYCVTEMLSAKDVLTKHQANTRYLYRHPSEQKLCYQLSGTHPSDLAAAAKKCQDLGADLIDLNVGCPKPKIRKKGAGSKLLETPETLYAIVSAMRQVITVPLTVKIRLQTETENQSIAKNIEACGADALIVHGRRWQDDYDVKANFEAIRSIKSVVNIPVIANGDIEDATSLNQAMSESCGDAFMIGRAGTGKPWLYQQLLTGVTAAPSIARRLELFRRHIEALVQLEGEALVTGQAKSLAKYYFKDVMAAPSLATSRGLSAGSSFITFDSIYQCVTLQEIIKTVHHQLLECAL